MDQEYVTRREYEEFDRRMKSENDRLNDENVRQNKRLDAVEQAQREFNSLALQIERMAASVETLAQQVAKQNDRIVAIEEKPSKRWEAVVTGVIGAAIGAIVTAIISGVVL